MRPPPEVSKRRLRRHLAQDAVIVQAGAHNGMETLELARMFPGGQIHAFEPVPRLYEELQRSTIGCPNVTTYRMALGDTEEVRSMWIAGGAQDASSSMLPPKDHLDVFPEITFENVIPVDVTTLAAWARREGIDRIDGLWLDMQGYELAALKAAGDLVATTRALVLEVSAAELYEEAPLWPEVRAWLEGAGFSIEAEKWDATGTWGDALAVRAR